MPSGAAEPPAVGAPADPPGERSGLTPLQQEFVSLLASITEGDFSRKILNLDESGADGEAIRAINAEKRRLGALLTTLITEITLIARELGTDGTFGGQAQVPGASGVWKHLVDSVNAMSYGLTHQVRDCAHVVEALSRGDATKRVTAEARGETLRLEQAINATVDRLRAVQ